MASSNANSSNRARRQLPSLHADPRLRALAAWALVFGALLLLYSPALQGQFLWDDPDNITPPELRSWSGLPRIWFQWGATQTYYPVLHTLYWVEQKLWGDATLGYHLASILFHSISVCLVYWIVRRLKIPGAALAAALFAVHPVYVESIAWITEQKNTLSGMFTLASILVYLRFDDSRRRATYAGALGLFLLALESKATAVTLPVALLVILWWKRDRLSWRRDLAPLLPWFALSLLVGLFTVWYERVYVGVQGSEFVLTPVQRCLLASRAVWFYLGKLFWPTNLILFYPRWEVNAAQAWQYLYVAGLIALLAAAWAVRRRFQAPLAALLFFLGTLFPLLGFFATYIFRYTYVCDHFQYLPSLGIVVLVSAAIALGLERLPAMSRYVGQGICVLFLCTLAVLTWQQSKIYTDIVTLFQAIVAKNPNCWLVYHNMGLILAGNGQTNKAIECYEKAISLYPDFPEAHNSLGLQLASLGQPEKAIDQYRHALRVRSDFPAALTNLGNALLDTGHPEQAVEQYRKALEINPDFYMANFNLGNSLLHEGRLDEAIERYRHTLRVRPQYAAAHYNLGNALIQAGKTQEAIAEFEQTVELKPDFPGARNNLASALLNTGQTEQAIEQFRQAVRQNPNSAAVARNLGNALRQSGRLEEALEVYRKVLELEPNDASTYATLTKALAALHRSADAIATAEQALNVARSQGQTELAQEIADWLKQYRVQQAQPHGTAAPGSADAPR